MIAVAEPLVADAAVDGAVQVVLVLLGALAALTVGIKHSLHLLERFEADERFVASGALDAVPCHDAGVVVVAQNAVQRRPSDRARRPCRCRTGTQSGFRDEIDERRQSVLTGRRQVEQDLHQRAAVGVNRYRGDIALADLFADVQVTKASRAVTAAGLVFAFQAELDLLGVAARTEGVHSGHDGVEQLAGRGVVDALKRGFQFAAAAFDLTQQPQCVEVVSGHAGEVVEDDVVRC